jgi:hypothetical protein
LSSDKLASSPKSAYAFQQDLARSNRGSHSDTKI